MGTVSSPAQVSERNRSAGFSSLAKCRDLTSFYALHTADVELLLTIFQKSTQL